MKKSEIVKHFVLEGIVAKTVYRTINRIDNGISLKRKSGSGNNRKISDKIKEKIIEQNVNEVGKSYRSIGREHKIHHQSAKRILDEAECIRKKRKKAPKSNENQKIRQKKCLQKLKRTLLKPSNDCEVVMDDESYFTIDGSDTYGNDFYYAYHGLEVPEEVKYRFVSKFTPKVMVWLAISSKGISEPLIVKSKNAINSQIYIEECLNKRLIQFINKHHSNGNYIFWPDLASSHYSNATQSAYARLKIKVVPKTSNPPNVPQVRPIENFWSILKSKVYSNGWTADSTEKLVEKIKLELKKMPINICQRLMSGVKTKVRKAADKGVLSVIN
jgi:transposase